MSYKDNMIERILIYLFNNKDKIDYSYKNKTYTISLDNDCYFEFSNDSIKYVTNRIIDCIRLNKCEIEIFNNILGGKNGRN